MDVKPLVSIIVPIYNSSKYLDRCVDSILNQKYKQIEVLLINDGSNDNSEEICKKFALKDRRVHVITKKNEGTSATRKLGVNLSKGKFISFVDSDDYIHPNMYERLVIEALKNNADIVQCGFNLVLENGEIIKKRQMKEELIESKYESSLFFARKKNVTNTLWNKLFSSKLFHDIHFPNLSLGEDVYLNTQLFGKANRVLTISDAYYYYVLTEGSLVRKSFNKKKLDSIKAGILMYEYYKKQYPDLIDFAILYICSMAARIYFQIGKSNIKEKDKLRSEVKNIFIKYYNNDVVEKRINDISRYRWILLKTFSKNPRLSEILFTLFTLIRRKRM